MAIKHMGIRRHFNRRLAWACLLIMTTTINYTIDNSGYSTTQAMDPFKKQFGTYNNEKGKWELPTVWLSLFNSMIFLGFAAGVIIGSYVSHHFGRRWCMFSMSCYALITATIAITSTSRSQIMAARILNYVYVGMELSVVPVFQSELVPTPVRGFIVGTYQLAIGIGGIIIHGICRGTGHIEDNRSWRIPMGCFFIIPTIIIAGIFFVPESPRWLLIKDRPEEAYESLKKLRDGTKPDDEIRLEFAALQLQLQAESEKGTFPELFKGTNLKRTAIICGVNFFQQATGQAFASTYGAIFIDSLNSLDPFTMTLVNSSINTVSVAAVLFLADKVGRKPLLLAGGVIQTAALLTMGGLGTDVPVSYNRSVGIVSMITVFGFGFSFGWAPLTYVLATEIPALRLRDVSSRVGFFTNVLTNFVVAFCIPYLINDGYAGLGGKVGYIFGSMAVMSLLFSYFFVPECTGKSLEQIDRMFQHGVPIRNFGSHKGDEDHVVLKSVDPTVLKDVTGVQIERIENA